MCSAKLLCRKEIFFWALFGSVLIIKGEKKMANACSIKSLVVWGHFTFNHSQTLKMGDTLTCLYNLSDLV